MATHKEWLQVIAETIASYRRQIDATIEQLSDAELHKRPTSNVNSVAVILRHIGGNLRSRWTDFLTTDGEKPDRDRDTEFMDWKGDRESLITHLDTGWTALTSALGQINESNIDQTIYIRGEPHSIPQALTRSLGHLTYHIGQIALVARLVHSGEWHWLTIAPGQSEVHNERTWGTNDSRSIFGETEE